MKQEQQIQKWRSQAFITKVVINICLASAVSGYFLAYFNTITFTDTIRIFSIEYDPAFTQGIVSFCIPLGAALGGYLSSLLTASYSRKECNLITAYVALVATLMLQSGNIYIIVVCRLVQGAYVGSTSVLRPLYIKQFSPLEISGKMGSFNQIMFILGLILSFVFTYLLSLVMQPEQYWRVVYINPVLFILIYIYNIKVNYPFETLKYLLEKGRKEQARELAGLIYKQQYVQQRIEQLQRIVHMTSQPQQIQLKEQSLQQPLSDTKNSKKGESNRWAILAAYNLSMQQQLTGMQVIIIYTGDVVLRIWPQVQKTLPILIHTLGLIASFQTIKLLATYGRKELIQKGTILLVLLNIIFVVCFVWKRGEDEGGQDMLPSLVIVVGFILFRIIFSATLGPIVWLYLPEIIEPNIFGIATMLNWLSAALISFAFPVVVQKLGGPEYMFGILVAIMLIGYAINRKLMIQTKGKSEWQIRQEYDQMSK